MRALVPLARELDTFFDAWPILDRVSFCPAMDVSEDDGGYRIEVDLPGMKPGEVDVTIENGDLTIKGERKIEKKGLHRSERAFGSFSRTISLGGPLDSESVEASFKDGTLTISVPKPKEARARKVAIKVVE